MRLSASFMMSQRWVLVSALFGGSLRPVRLPLHDVTWGWGSPPWVRSISCGGLQQDSCKGHVVGARS